MNLLTLFIILNVLNVIIQTIKSLATVKCGKGIASIVNAIAYGLYTVCLVYMNCNLSLLAKVLVVGGANLVGVYIVKFIEEKMRKDRLWEIRMTCQAQDTNKIDNLLTEKKIPHNYIENVGTHTIFNIYCETQEQSANVSQIVKLYKCKYFINENKGVL